MLTRYVCDKRELSCLIPNIFKEIKEPCCRCKEEINDIVIYGTTYDNKEATLIIRDYGFDYYGDEKIINKIRKQRCPIEQK